MMPSHDTIPQTKQPATWYLVDCIGILPPWKIQQFILGKIKIHYWYEFALPVHRPKQEPLFKNLQSI